MRIKIKIVISENSEEYIRDIYSDENIINKYNNFDLALTEENDSISVKSFEDITKYLIENSEFDIITKEKIEKIFISFDRKENKFLFPVDLNKIKKVLELKKKIAEFLDEFYYKYFLFDDFRIKDIIQYDENIM